MFGDLAQAAYQSALNNSMQSLAQQSGLQSLSSVGSGLNGGYARYQECAPAPKPAPQGIREELQSEINKWLEPI